MLIRFNHILYNAYTVDARDWSARIDSVLSWLVRVL